MEKPKKKTLEYYSWDEVIRYLESLHSETGISPANVLVACETITDTIYVEGDFFFLDLSYLQRFDANHQVKLLLSVILEKFGTGDNLACLFQINF